MDKRNKAVILFMEIKQIWLRHHLPEAFEGNENEYFNKKDKNAIKNWKPFRCWKIIDYLYNNGTGFNTKTCPFCINQSYSIHCSINEIYCNGCKYKKNGHLCCLNDDEQTSYSKISSDYYDNNLDLTNEIIKQWIDDIRCILDL